MVLVHLLLRFAFSLHRLWYLIPNSYCVSVYRTTGFRVPFHVLDEQAPTGKVRRSYHVNIYTPPTQHGEMLLTRPSILWGGVCMCLAAPKNFAGFAAVRFLLGFTEGAVSPAFVTITSIWYRKKEHPLRVGYVYIYFISAWLLPRSNRYSTAHGLQ